MLRINALKSASDYYTKSLTKGDYYSEQAEISGEWQGLGAKKLGLDGEINKEQFDLLCAGNHPLTGEQLSSRIVADRKRHRRNRTQNSKWGNISNQIHKPKIR
jgi:conjugative relaxase-like TrwC/TraI family protein